MTSSEPSALGKVKGEPGARLDWAETEDGEAVATFSGWEATATKGNWSLIHKSGATLLSPRPNQATVMENRIAAEKALESLGVQIETSGGLPFPDLTWTERMTGSTRSQAGRFRMVVDPPELHKLGGGYRAQLFIDTRCVDIALGLISKNDAKMWCVFALARLAGPATINARAQERERIAKHFDRLARIDCEEIARVRSHPARLENPELADIIAREHAVSQARNENIACTIRRNELQGDDPT